MPSHDLAEFATTPGLRSGLTLSTAPPLAQPSHTPSNLAPELGSGSIFGSPPPAIKLQGLYLNKVAWLNKLKGFLFPD